MINLFNIPDLIERLAASDIEIQAVENHMNVTLPNAYKELLRCTNGFSIGGRLLIYGTEHIAERNEVWEVDEYAMGYVAIGDDGGGNVFLMAQHAKEKEVLVIGSGDMNPSHATVITSDFKKWVNSGCISEIEQKTINKSSDICNIVLVKTPSEGLKDLIKIKNILGLEISAIDLLKGSKNLPYILVERFPYGKAKKLIGKSAIDSTILSIEVAGKNS
ncbi:1,3-beta-glucan synthase regulator [Bacillus toyonensis]|uniref:SMI1/KNR4 family protein n=1 Tax=Bacillus toyonensis TaxID=155322 RepID=UPI000BF82798|nr:SMI1/KNR4 family protein [Bacillus toyonensis]PGE13305.1 1,3-beta-glucan synthase regulator [Bacillus toyonensis]